MMRPNRAFRLVVVSLFLVASLSSMGCDTGPNSKVSNGGTLTATGAKLLEIDHPVMKVIGVILVATGSFLMLDGVFGDESRPVMLTSEQHAKLTAGSLVEIRDRDGNKQKVSRLYVPKVTKVVSGSDAESLGIQAGDLLISYSGASLASSTKSGNPVAAVVKGWNSVEHKEVFTSLVTRRGEREIKHLVLGGKLLGIAYVYE